MKHFIFLHNQVTMALATVSNSVQGFTYPERFEIKEAMCDMINRAFDAEQITQYQRDKLHDIAVQIIKEW